MKTLNNYLNQYEYSGNIGAVVSALSEMIDDLAKEVEELKKKINPKKK